MVRTPILLLLVTSLASAGTQFSTYFGGKFAEYISAVVTDAAGNIYVTGQTGSPDFPVTPGAAQTTIGGGSDAFVAKFTSAGALVWCTYFGGSGSDGARGIGVDSAGNVVIAGQTDSLNLPAVNAFQTALDNGHLRYGLDAFVAKVSADGSRFLYASYLGGNGNDYAWAVTADPAGNAYVTGYTDPTNFFPGPDGPVDETHPFTYCFVVKISQDGRVVFTRFLDNLTPRGIAVDRDSNIYLTGGGSAPGQLNLNPSSRAVVTKLSADGSAEIFRSTLGGSILDIGTAIAIDASGNAWITGMTASADFPLIHPVQSNFGARSLWRSTDATATWAPVDNAPFGQISATLAESGGLYVASYDSGLWITTDGGATWSRAGGGLPSSAVRALVRDAGSRNMLAAAGGVIYQSTDNGQTWTASSNGLTRSPAIRLLASDAMDPGAIYAAGDQLYKSTDGGSSWSAVTALAAVCQGCTQALAVDPATGNVFAADAPPIFGPGFFGTPPPPKSLVYRSSDGGASWKNQPNVYFPVKSFLVDTTTQPSTIYASLARSDDGGQTWTPLSSPQGVNFGSLSLDSSTGTLYAVSTYPGTNIYLSRDHGATWQQAPGTPFAGPQGVIPSIDSVIPDPTSPGAFYVTASGYHTDAFVARLSSDGSSWLFSTFLGGHAVFDPAQAGGGGFVYTNLQYVNGATYGEGIAIDADGNVAVTGGTRSTDFPTVNPMQPVSANALDNFITVFSPDAGSILYSTYFGGSASDAARGVAIDPTGALVIAGQTNSTDFPVANAAQSNATEYGDAFLTKLTWRDR